MVIFFTVRGFKNLAPTPIRMGPLLGVAGPNGAGKSNLLDALCLLRGLATGTVAEALRELRGTAFSKAGSDSLELEVDFLTDSLDVDELGMPARATATFLRYQLIISLAASGFRIEREDLFSLPDARERLQEIGSPNWVNSVLIDPGERWFIRTSPDNDATHLELDGEGKAAFGSQTSGMKRTLLSSCSQAGHQPTAFLARRALARIALYHFEPSALRSVDSLSERFDEEQPIDSRGRHLPLSLLRLSERDPSVATRIANTLATVVEGIDSLRADRNDTTKSVEIRLTDLSPRELNGSLPREFGADSLSDGTLRVLALALLLHDPRVLGTLLLEEPENGVHPNQLPALLNLLRDIACDTDLPVDETNPLRQLCFTTHSPGLVGLLRPEEMRFAVRGDSNLGEIRFLPVGPKGVPTHLLWGFLHEEGSEITGTLAAQAEEFTRALGEP